MANTIDQDYLAKRQLKKGTAGWVLLAGLGVSYVISGDFAGWNFGLAEAGWGGFAIAAALMATMYFALVLSLVAMTGVYAFDPRAFNYTLVLFVIGAVYFFAYGRRHLVAKSADEELALILDAEHDLDEMDGVHLPEAELPLQADTSRA